MLLIRGVSPANMASWPGPRRVNAARLSLGPSGHPFGWPRRRHSADAPDRVWKWFLILKLKLHHSALSRVSARTRFDYLTMATYIVEKRREPPWFWEALFFRIDDSLFWIELGLTGAQIRNRAHHRIDVRVIHQHVAG